MKQNKRISLIGKSLTIDNNKILMVLRNRPHQSSAHNKWELPGGKVEFGEHPKVTCERECLEETGYKVKSLELVKELHTFVWSREEEDVNVIVVCYTAKLLGGEPSTEDKGVNKVKWFDFNELPSKEECIPGTIELIKKYLDNE